MPLPFLATHQSYDSTPSSTMGHWQASILIQFIYWFQVLPSKDPLDRPDLNITEYINSIFPTEQSLNNIDDVIANLESKILSIEDEMRSVIRGQTNITEVSF